MKTAYPVIFTKVKKSDDYLVDIPDLDRQTEGKDLADAIYMARDLLGLLLVDMEDAGEPLPSPTSIEKIDVTKGEFAKAGKSFVSMVDIDTGDYRRRVLMQSSKSVRRNIALPEWLDTEARKAKINVSKIAQKALMERLGVYSA